LKPLTEGAAAEAAAGAPKKERIGFYGWYVILVLMLCQMLSTIDARLPFILVEALKADLNLSDTQIGIITGPAHSLTFAIAALPIAKLSDRYVRKHVIAIAIVAWSACTAAGGFSRGFVSFGLSRIGVAIGESALTPAAHSIMAGYTTPVSRPTAMAIYALGIAIGAFVALAIGGWISDTYGWRTALLLVGASGVLLALLVALSIKEPGRRADPGAKNLPKSSFRSILGHAAMRNIILGGALMGLSTGALNAWAPSYIMRTFHLSATQTGASFGGLSAMLGIAGLLMGGFIASWLANKRQGDAFRMLAIAFALATIAQLGCFMVDNYVLFLALTATSTLFVAAYFAPTYAGVQSLADPSARSFAAAVTLFAVNGVGIASGAFFAGLLSDVFRPIAGEESLRWSLLTLTAVKFLAAWPYWAAARAMDKMNEAARLA
jgi:predicted MFS family arabinose efflux permease